MKWIDEKIEKINKALEEIETVNLTSETKTTILSNLKEELKHLEFQKKQIISNTEFVKNGIGK